MFRAITLLERNCHVRRSECPATSDIRPKEPIRSITGGAVNKNSRVSRQIPTRISLISAAVAGALLSAYSPSHARVEPMNVRGVVAGSHFTPSAGTALSNTTASYYQGAKVCVDANNNGVCDAGEASTLSDNQ